MIDNLLLGPEAQINHTIAAMRGSPAEGLVANGARLAPLAFLSIDPQAEIEGRFVTGGGDALRLDYMPHTVPGWMAIHLPMGGGDLSGRSVFGVVCRSRADAALTMRICLRSGLPGPGADSGPGGFADAFLPKHMLSFADPSTHVDLLRLEDTPDIPATAEWRELLIFLPPRSSSIVLTDLRVFIV